MLTQSSFFQPAVDWQNFWKCLQTSNKIGVKLNRWLQTGMYLGFCKEGV